jgi:uncharacterized protein YbcV (DUF1398 family)
MDAQQQSIARNCLTACYENTTDFPSIVGALIAAGFEGYIVDYRRGTTIYYLPDGDSLELANRKSEGMVAALFDKAGMQAAVREAQTKAPGYTYAGFCEKAKACGCAGYFVSFLGRQVVYYGRTAETHVEHFPNK